MITLLVCLVLFILFLIFLEKKNKRNKIKIKCLQNSKKKEVQNCIQLFKDMYFKKDILIDDLDFNKDLQIKLEDSKDKPKTNTNTKSKKRSNKSSKNLKVLPKSNSNSKLNTKKSFGLTELFYIILVCIFLMIVSYYSLNDQALLKTSNINFEYTS